MTSPAISPAIIMQMELQLIRRACSSKCIMAELVILVPTELGLFFGTCFRAMAFLSGLLRTSFNIARSVRRATDP